jgi:hypothetical protein
MNAISKFKNAAKTNHINLWLIYSFWFSKIRLFSACSNLLNYGNKIVWDVGVVLLYKDKFKMGSIVFRNRYWFYKSLYDDYLGRDFKLSFGISCLLWMPHYWYNWKHKGWEYRLTGLSNRALHIRTTSLNITQGETEWLIT